jgi:DNA-binding NarL/FixJ family response regulator
MCVDSQTRVLVVDNDARVRSALQTLLKQEPGVIVVRESPDLGSLAAQYKEFQPDLVLLDWELPGRPAAALLFALNGCDFQAKVIVLSKRPESERAALEAGADAFVSKADPPERLLRAFRSLLSPPERGEEEERQSC